MVILLDGTFSNNLLEFTSVQVGLLSRTVHASFKCTSNSTENVRNLFLNNPELETMVLEFRNIILVRRTWLQSLQKIFPNKNFHLFQNIFGYANDNQNLPPNSFNSSCKLVCCRPPGPTVDDSHSNVTIQKFAVFITERIFAPEVFASLLCYKGGISNPLPLPPMMIPPACSSLVEHPTPSASRHPPHPTPTPTPVRSSSYTAFPFQSGSPEDFHDIHCANTLEELCGMIDALEKEDLEGTFEGSPFSLVATAEDDSAPNSNLSSDVMSPYSPISPVTSRYVTASVEKRENEPLDLRYPTQ